MKTYFVDYRISGSDLLYFAGEFHARSEVGAVAQASRRLANISGRLEIIATLKD